MADLVVGRPIIEAQIIRITRPRAAFAFEREDVKILTPDVGSQELQSVRELAIQTDLQGIVIGPEADIFHFERTITWRLNARSRGIAHDVLHRTKTAARVFVGALLRGGFAV